MSSQQYQILTQNPNNFLPTQNTKIFVSSAYNSVKGTPPQEYNISVTTASTPTLVGDIMTADITLAEDIAVTLYEGTRFQFADDKLYYLREEITFPGGSTDQNLLGVTFEADADSVVAVADDAVVLRSVIPYFSANTFNATDNGEVIEENVFSNGFPMEKALIGLNQSVEISGAKVIGDPGLLQAKESRNTGKVLDVDVVYPFCNGYESFTGFFSDLPRTNERAGFQQITATLQVTGVITERVR